ncbi:MAG: adenylate kinase family protein [Thermoplasmata archaeon]|nr:MAG: adenylate kinase family protein [Thermoplasmata archaeon]
MPEVAALTGTPGTGKSAIAGVLSTLGWTVMEMGELAQREGAVVGRDEARQTDEVDTDLLAEALEGELRNDHGDRVLLVGHLSHLMPCSVIVVLRTSPTVLRARLEERGWPQAKVDENVEAEAVGVVLVESMERDEPVPVYEVDTSGSSVEESARTVAATLQGAGEGMEAGWVDWSEEVMGWY